ncbi:MAG: hypothetical protein FWH24_00150 [Oscillospiraceae bacterium]|nr:hypothetical protein [Oscillospiraceae bacterium]
MIKFLLCLPLVLFIAAEGFIVYHLGNIIFSTTNDNIIGLIGDWSFNQIVLAMIGIIAGIVLAAFMYVIVVIKPVFYPSSEEAQPQKKRGGSRGASDSEGSKILIIVLIAVGVFVIALAAAGFIFRENISNFFGSVFGSEAAVDGFQSMANTNNGAEIESVEENADENGETEDAAEDSEDDENGDGDENENEDEDGETGDNEDTENAGDVEETRLSYDDVLYDWTLYYPGSLTIADTEPLENWDTARVPSDTAPRIMYWSEDNIEGYTAAADYAEYLGLAASAEEFSVIDGNTLIALFNGGNYWSARFWHIEPDGVAFVDISLETAEAAANWYTILEAGNIYIG